MYVCMLGLKIFCILHVLYRKSTEQEQPPALWSLTFPSLRQDIMVRYAHVEWFLFQTERGRGTAVYVSTTKMAGNL